MSGPFDRLTAVLHDEPDEEGLDGLAAACAELTLVAGAAIVVQVDHQPRSGVGSSARWVAALEDAQFTLGEGPVVEAITERQPVLVDDVAATPRWQHLTGVFDETSVQAVYALPLDADGVRLGALALYHDRPDGIPPARRRPMWAVADALAHLLLLLVFGADDDTLTWPLEQAAARQAVVHQAAGMVAAQLRCHPDDALVRLRARAYADDERLEDMAHRVVAGELRLRP